MWPVWSAHLDRTSCDLSFTEAISQRMQVPSHLKVADSAIMAGEQRPPEEDCSPSFQMHVPERLLLSEMMEVASRTPFGCGRTNGWGVADKTLFEPPDQAAIYRERPFLTLISQAASQKRRHQVHHSRARKARVPLMVEEISPLALEDPRLRQARLELSLPPASQSPELPLLLHTQFPPVPPEGRIYSVQNILQALYLLGRILFQLFWKPGRGHPSSRDTSTGLEEFGTADMLAMKKQVARISGRLQALEAQCVGWRQKELLFYSVLGPACLFHLWLWLRR